MELPQYLQKQNPSAATFDEFKPGVEVDYNKLSKTFNLLLDDVKQFRNSQITTNAQTEYELWLLKERDDLQRNTDLNDVEVRTQEFLRKSSDKIDELLQGLPRKQRLATSMQMHHHYDVRNLDYSMQVTAGIKQKAYAVQNYEQKNKDFEKYSTATAAQLQGSNGHEMLDQDNLKAENDAIIAYQNGFITKSDIPAKVMENKIRNTINYSGRMQVVAPKELNNMLTNNSAAYEDALLDYYDKHKESSKHQSIWTNKDTRYKDFQAAIKDLDADTRMRLGIGNVYVKSGKEVEILTASRRYDLGGIYSEADTKGISFSEAVNDPEILAKYATPENQYFTKSSIFYNSETKDFAGFYKDGSYYPAGCNPESKFFNKALEFLTPEARSAAIESTASYLTQLEKQKQQTEKLAALQERWEKEQKLISNETMTGDVPVYTGTSPSGNSTPAAISSTRAVVTGTGDNKTYSPPTSRPISYDPTDSFKNTPFPAVSYTRREINDHIKTMAEKHDIPLDAAMALCMTESNFNPYAFRSNSKQPSDTSYGICQLTPRTAKSLGVIGKNIWDLDVNLDAGFRYYKQCLIAAGGNPSLAYVAYNAGIGGYRKYIAGTHSRTKQIDRNRASFNRAYSLVTNK